MIGDSTNLTGKVGNTAQTLHTRHDNKRIADNCAVDSASYAVGTSASVRSVTNLPG